MGRKTAESARWLAALVENSSDSIMGVDGRGIIQSWNTGAQRLFGYTAGEMIGRRSDVLIPPGRTDELEEVLGDDEQFIDSFRFETARVRKDRTLVEVAFTASRVRDDQGNGLGWSLVARDVTESNRLCGSDLVARWGGEEFVAIVGADVAGAAALCERAREAVARLEIPGVGQVSISAGVSAISDDFDTALERADAALYQAKARGRNRVERA